jgi:hypothetical protein
LKSLRKPKRNPRSGLPEKRSEVPVGAQRRLSKRNKEPLTAQVAKEVPQRREEKQNRNQNTSIPIGTTDNSPARVVPG